MIDAHELRSYPTFGTDRVSLLLAVARAKENPNGDSPPVFRRVVTDSSELLEAIDSLDQAVSRFDERYRCYLSVNARNTLTAFFELRDRFDDWLLARLHGDEGINRKFAQIHQEFKSVLQSDACKDDTNFLFDLDDAEPADRDQLIADLERLTDVHLVTETPNGYHVVTAPFNDTELETRVDDECKSDGMVFLAFLGDGELPSALRAGSLGGPP